MHPKTVVQPVDPVIPFVHACGKAVGLPHGGVLFGGVGYQQLRFDVRAETAGRERILVIRRWIRTPAHPVLLVGHLDGAGRRIQRQAQAAVFHRQLLLAGDQRAGLHPLRRRRGGLIPIRRRAAGKQRCCRQHGSIPQESTAPDTLYFHRTSSFRTLSRIKSPLLYGTSVHRIRS